MEIFFYCVLALVMVGATVVLVREYLDNRAFVADMTARIGRAHDEIDALDAIDYDRRWR